MKYKLILLSIILITGIKSFAQDSKISLQLNYPIPIGENFIETSYEGIFDIGANIQLINLNNIDYGISFNGGILKGLKGFNNINVTSYIIQPKLYVALEAFDKIHPFFGIGYSTMIFHYIYQFNGLEIKNSSTDGGLNFNFGIEYDITQKIYAQGGFDFIKIDVDHNIPKTKFNTDIKILKVGLGYRWAS